MPTQQNYTSPKRKEPGLIGTLCSVIIQAVVWLLISVIISIIIEWTGMTLFWPEQGSDHAKQVLQDDLVYLNRAFYDESLMVKQRVITLTEETIDWLVKQSWPPSIIHGVSDQSNSLVLSLNGWLGNWYQQHRDYIHASGYVVQTVVVRLALLFFSLPVFIMAAFVGAADGLVERDLRRWGGGRESSHVFRIARRSVTPTFLSACVIYISLPFSLDPALVIMPFALLLGIVVRVSFERLKKYF